MKIFLTIFGNLCITEMSTNAFLKSWLYLLTTIYFSFAYEKLIQKAGRNKGFDDLYTYDGAIGVYDRHNVFECSNTCSDNVKCLSFFFHFELKTCILHPLPFWNSYPQQYQVGWRSYIAQDGKFYPYVTFLILYLRSTNKCINC